MIHSWLCGRVNDKKTFHTGDFRKQGWFFLALDKKTKYIAIILPPNWLVCKFSNKSNKILALGLICLILGSGFWFLVLVITLSILICALHAATLCFLICTIQLMCRTFFRWIHWTPSLFSSASSVQFSSSSSLQFSNQPGRVPQPPFGLN